MSWLRFWQGHKEAIGLYGKLFSHNYAFGEIHGKDHANRTNVGCAEDDEEEGRREDANEGDDNSIRMQETFEEFEESFASQ